MHNIVFDLNEAQPRWHLSATIVNYSDGTYDAIFFHFDSMYSQKNRDSIRFDRCTGQYRSCGMPPLVVCPVVPPVRPLLSSQEAATAR